MKQMMTINMIVAMLLIFINSVSTVIVTKIILRQEKFEWVMFVYLGAFVALLGVSAWQVLIHLL